MDRLPLLAPKQKQKTVIDNRFAPKFTKQLEPQSGTEDVCIILSVEFTSSPASEAIWYKDGFQMQSSEDFMINSNATSSSLKIKKAYKSDSGMYQVKIFNEVGVAQSRAYLTVNPADLADLTPRILLNLKNFTVHSGEPVKFQSQAVGNPAPVISWFKDDEPLEMNSRVKEFKEGDTYTLLIFESIAADSGCYEMVAENGHGKVYTRSYLTVIGDKQIHEPEPVPVVYDQNNVRSIPLSSKFTQPAIEVPLKDQVAKEGSTVKFECIIVHSERKFILSFFYSFINKLMHLIVGFYLQQKQLFNGSKRIA